MTFLLIIADDFTGALDTGVQFAACGDLHKVVVDPETDLSGDRAPGPGGRYGDPPSSGRRSPLSRFAAGRAGQKSRDPVYL